MISCPDWPPPLPSLPLYPPCVPKQKTKAPPPVIKNSSHQEWWNDVLSDTLKRAAGAKSPKKSKMYELTSRQRRELLPIKIPTKQDRLIWSIPLPAGSYPPNGLPIWERLYLDQRLPMMKAPPDALVFARQQIGKKLWKDTVGQEFILYDPQGYEVQFSYENVHDPHLTNYYQGKEIRNFLLSVGDANADGWGICTLRRFNQYRKYLRRVHISQVHKQMKNQDSMQDEHHRIQMYKQITMDAMEEIERKAIMNEAVAAAREILKQNHIDRINKILRNIRKKERRVAKLNRRREKEQQKKIKEGQVLQMEQQLKKEISAEINRRRKIVTLRRWHERDERQMRILKKIAEEKAAQKAEKVRLRWQNKIENSKKMFVAEDELLRLQSDIKRRNIDIRNKCTEKIKQKQMDKFQELRKMVLKKKELAKRRIEDKKMEDAIMSTWLGVIRTRVASTIDDKTTFQQYDLDTEIYRVKKSLNSTMAELLSQDMEGPDRYSIIANARNRIQREQSIPLQVSFAIEVLLETSIELWAIKRLNCIFETVLRQIVQHAKETLQQLKLRGKQKGAVFSNFKSSDPKGIIFKEDEIEEPEKKFDKRKETADSSRTTFAETEIKEDAPKQKEQITVSPTETKAEDTKGFLMNYVHFGPTETFEYRSEKTRTKLKPTKGRPKTPMPTQKVLCEAGFSEEKLKDILPTMSDVVTLKEKRKFKKAFKKAGIELFKRAIVVTDLACEPSSRIRTINKLVRLGDGERPIVVRTLCSLLMNKAEKAMFESQEFEWMSNTLARDAINEVLRPVELQKIQNDGVARTKIMFYKPRDKNRK